MPTTVTSLVIIVIFVLPGFIFDWTLERLVPLRAKSDLQRVLSALVFSGLMWLVPGMPLYRYWLHAQSISGTAWRSAIFIVGLPLILGCAVAKLGTPVRDFLSNRLGIRVLDPHPAAWDWAMSRRKGDWVIVQTTDGKVYGGIYGAKSQAGESTSSPDLFLEQSWKIDPRTKEFLKAHANSGGLYFSADSIQHVEFRKPANRGAAMSDDTAGNSPEPPAPAPEPPAPAPEPPAPAPPFEGGLSEVVDKRFRPLETPDVTNPPKGDEE